MSGKQFKLKSIFKTVLVEALVCFVYGVMNRKNRKKIKKLNKGILKGKKLKKAKLEIRLKQKVLGQKWEHYIEVGDEILDLVFAVAAQL